MILHVLKLDNFRNYHHMEVTWHEQANLLQGANAQGKSNLLEAICLLSLTTSFRGVGEADLITKGESYFYVEGQVSKGESSDGEEDFTICAAYSADKRRKWKVGLKECRRGEVVGLLHTVIFSPEDVDLVKAGPMQRRRFLNRQISQLYPEHCRLLLRYNRILAQRNRCLKLLQQPETAAGANEALSVWDQQLAENGAAIIWQRRQVLAQLNPLAAQFHGELAAQEKLHLSYKSFAGAVEASDKTELMALFLAELKRASAYERSRGTTVIGPHRDDLQIEIAGAIGKGYASQGQQRTAALACKLAELHLAYNKKKEWPLLLLDDVLSELDSRRQQALLKKIDGGAQTFIACTDSLPLQYGQVWRVESGELRVKS
ncbi:MAG: DNA replication/repair protein RecF [Clostridiales bacterium]|nr:DNA replication/repair protein RecF [Clostridiales bacterium]